MMLIIGMISNEILAKNFISFGIVSFYNGYMDTEWFKAKHKSSGVTQAEMARRLGKTPTFLTRVYSGDQALKVEQATLVARAFGVPLAEVLAHLGDVDASAAEGDDAWREDREAPEEIKKSYQGETWVIRRPSLILAGYAPGDVAFIASNVEPERDDVVLAQAYDWSIGGLRTVVRIYQPPFLLEASAAAPAGPPLMLGESTSILGVVVASWRHRRKK